jgi:glutamyl-tRNA synthetase
VGGVRTALFNWLHARHHGGTFLLRVEDTDRQRSQAQWTEEILGAMRWLGLDWDEGPFFQTERTAHYLRAIDRLLESGSAYYCTCPPEDLDARRKAAIAAGARPAYDRHCRPGIGPGPTPGVAGAVRFAIPLEGEVVIEDAVKGSVVFANVEIEDFVIARGDGTPTYNLCVAVDDADMAITDVIRGDDHLANTPKQIHIYRALGAALPRFAHLPQVLGMDRARLSKRHAATAVTSYRELGYYPDALVNFLARLGWSHGDQEIFSREELVGSFDLDHVGKSAGVFNLEKLDWLNAHYLKQRTPAQLASDLRPFMEARDVAIPGDDAWLARMAATLQERSKTLLELTESAHWYLSDQLVFDEKAVAKFLVPDNAGVLRDLAAGLGALPAWDTRGIEGVFAGILETSGRKLGALAQPVRVAVTGGTVSPGIFEVLDVLGRERSLARLDAAIARIGTAPGAA